MKEMVDKKSYLVNWIKEGVTLSDSNVGLIKSLEGKCEETENTLLSLIKENEERTKLSSSKSGGKKNEQKSAPRKSIPILSRRSGKKM